MKKIFLVAGESSGDILGARLIRSLKILLPEAEFSGIGGPLMQSEGFNSLYPMERLSIMGIVPILKRLPELLKMRASLARTIVESKADCFIGIDAPEFNLGLEYKLKRKSIPTVHYVSPSVWAWRENRIYKIGKSVSLMLCLFPFELSIYRRHDIPAICIGHPLANEIPMQPDTQKAREQLAISVNARVVALLPGSRGSEIRYLMEPFYRTAEKLTARYPDIEFVLPCANAKGRRQIEAFLAARSSDTQTVPIRLIDGQSRLVMQAANAILLASGTATLEALLLKKPMLVAYKMSALSLWIFRKLLKIKQYSLPNLLAQKEIVKEMIQEECEPEKLYAQMSQIIDETGNDSRSALFQELHQSLKLGGSDKAAQSIYQLIENTQIKESQNK